eukprot:g24698.t1
MADAISLALHSSLELLDNKDTYARFLLIDYSSTFNIIIPNKFISKLQDLSHISNKDQTEYSKKIECFMVWCNDNDLSIKVSKELVISFRKQSGGHAPICMNGAEVEVVERVRFLGVTITNNLSWSIYIDVMVKKSQHLYFLRKLRKFNTSTMTLANVYRCTIESILSGCITA